MGFEDALWVYGLVIDHVATRLAYLEEELFIGLHVDIGEYEPEIGETVWIRPTGRGFNPVDRISGQEF